MNSVSTIDLYSIPFWVAVVIACLVMIPLNHGQARKIAWAVINLGFLGYFLRLKVLAVFGMLGVIYVSLRMLRRDRLALVPLLIGPPTLLGMFLTYKLPSLFAETVVGNWHPAMEAIGFSYFALRVIDLARAVYEGRHPAPCFCSLVNYLLPFHMLSAGPIQAYDDFAAQPNVSPPLTPTISLIAFERIAGGMFKKYVLANLINSMFLTSFKAGWPYFLFEVQVNYLWLFLDFSAYSDIAVGIGMLMGVATPENFNRPYIARNSIDYWERWHISLSQWIRRNIFMPIQVTLVRKTGGKHVLVIASFAFYVSFLLCGLWHQIGLNWLIWGAYHATGLVICNLYRDFLIRKLGRKGHIQYLSRPGVRLFAIFLTFEFVAFSLVPVTYRGDLWNFLKWG